MTDPLSLLRQYNINKKEIIEHDGQIIFGEYSWPKNVKTNYVVWVSPSHAKKSDSEDSTKQYYTLESLLFFLKNNDLVHPEYVRQAEAANMQVVRRPVRKELLKYLNGEIATTNSLEKIPLLETPTQVKRRHDYDDGNFEAKKTRFEGTCKKNKRRIRGRKDC